MDLEFDVVELGPADHPEEGETAPDFTRPLVNDEFWEDVALSELVARDGDPTVLVFHPMDGAFPATYMWTEIRDRGWGADADATVVGVSISTPYEHGAFIDRYDLEYRLFSDPANGVAERYGVVHDLDGMAGVTEPRPAVVLVDGDRTVRYTWAAEEWPEFPPYDETEAAIAEL